MDTTTAPAPSSPSPAAPPPTTPPVGGATGSGSTPAKRTAAPTRPTNLADVVDLINDLRGTLRKVPAERRAEVAAALRVTLTDPVLRTAIAALYAGAAKGRNVDDTLYAEALAPVATSLGFA